jgi:hypothetical protein
VQYEIGDRVIPAQRTTPESLEIQQMMAAMVRGDCQACVMEVSSHALEQKRVFGVEFDMAIFTNLTRDHLDYHGTMEKYFEAKAKLFGKLKERGMKRGITKYANLKTDCPLYYVETHYFDCIFFQDHKLSGCLTVRDLEKLVGRIASDLQASYGTKPKFIALPKLYTAIRDMKRKLKKNREKHIEAWLQQHSYIQEGDNKLQLPLRPEEKASY